jgi:aldehyde:ferredoxin oxidoreductase
VLNRKLAIIDLGRGKVKVEEPSVSLRKALLGGRGLNSYYLYKMLPPKVDPLSPRNVLVIGTGFLTGTIAPSSSRFNTSAKSPESNILGDANCGGFFAPELRFAGFDRVILTGKAKVPSYIHVEDGTIEIRKAKDYWGMDTNDVQKAMKDDLGEVEVLCCGVAGEKMVRFACLRTGLKNAAGRGGMGAVMGSKNVKAITAYGSQGLEIKHPEKLLEYAEELKDYVTGSKVTKILGTVGTPFLYEISNEFGAIRTKNSQLNSWSAALNADEVEKLVDKMISCFGCYTHCRHRNSLNGEGPEYTTLGLMGANIGLDDPGEVIELNNMCNDLGLDVSSTGTILAWAFELFERGMIDKKITKGQKLGFGDFELAKDLVYKISRRKGFGDILAESSQAAKYFGPKSKDYLIAVKNLPQSDPHDVRYLKAFSLGIAVASRGADHLRNRPTLEIFFRLPKEVKERIYGKGIELDPTSYNAKEKSVYFSDNMYAVIDSVGICKFTCHGFNSPKLIDYERVSKLIYLSSGLRLSKKDLEDVGRRVIDIERLFNLREGVRRRDDTLPKRYFDEPMTQKIAKGHKIDRREFDKMLSRYYKIRGWNSEGMLTKKRTKELEAIA